MERANFRRSAGRGKGLGDLHLRTRAFTPGTALDRTLRVIPLPSTSRRAALLALALAAGGACAASALPPDPAEQAVQAVRAAAAGARAANEDRFDVRFASPELADNVQGNADVASAIVRL